MDIECPVCKYRYSRVNGERQVGIASFKSIQVMAITRQDSDNGKMKLDREDIQAKICPCCGVFLWADLYC